MRLHQTNKLLCSQENYQQNEKVPAEWEKVSSANHTPDKEWMSKIHKELMLLNSKKTNNTPITAIGFQVKLELRMCTVWSEHVTAQTHKGSRDAYLTSRGTRTVLEMSVALVAPTQVTRQRDRYALGPPAAPPAGHPSTARHPESASRQFPGFIPPQSKGNKPLSLEMCQSWNESRQAKTDPQQPRSQPTSRFTEPRALTT